MNLCIYNKKNVCLVREVNINEFGMCGGCTIVSLSNSMVEEKKLRQRTEIKNRKFPGE